MELSTNHQKGCVAENLVKEDELSLEVWNMPRCHTGLGIPLARKINCESEKVVSVFFPGDRSNHGVFPTQLDFSHPSLSVFTRDQHGEHDGLSVIAFPRFNNYCQSLSIVEKGFKLA